MNESVLDHPQEDLDSSVWTRDESGTYVLTPEAEEKISNVVSFMTTEDETGLHSFKVRITGSITSNQYSDRSDIDVHFSSDEIPEADAEEFNKRFREKFEEEFKKIYPKAAFTIGTHQIEVYFQANPHQDMMSIGCYDFLGKMWLVGPEFTSQDFDPYSEYYHENMQYVNSIIDDIRSVILECYEHAMVLKSSKDRMFVQSEYRDVFGKLARAATVFQRAREFRKACSSPKSDEQALSFRASRKWKVADSAFKLLDKFGYLGILREFTKCYEEIQDGQTSMDDVVDRIVNVVQNNIMQNPKLVNTNKLLETELEEESLRGIGKVAALVSLLAIPGVTNARMLTKELEKLPKTELRAGSEGVNDAIVLSSRDRRSFDGLSYPHLVNLVATIVYNEAMTDYLRCGRDIRCLIAIGNVIGNRSGGRPERFAREIMRHTDGGWQFVSAKKHVKGGIKDSDYRTWDPVVLGGDRKCWEECEKIAKKLIDGKLENVIGTANMIANRKLDAKEAFEKWGSKCAIRVSPRSLHTFGYDRTQDWRRRYSDGKKPIKTDGGKVHVIRAGDTISGIAKKNGTTVAEILRKNTWLKDANKIQIGKKLKV
jgi:hypothetical protein